jgi:hypothetical protein
MEMRSSCDRSIATAQFHPQDFHTVREFPSAVCLSACTFFIRRMRALLCFTAAALFGGPTLEPAKNRCFSHFSLYSGNLDPL